MSIFKVYTLKLIDGEATFENEADRELVIRSVELSNLGGNTVSMVVSKLDDNDEVFSQVEVPLAGYGYFVLFDDLVSVLPENHKLHFEGIDEDDNVVIAINGVL